MSFLEAAEKYRREVDILVPDCEATMKGMKFYLLCLALDAGIDLISLVKRRRANQSRSSSMYDTLRH